MYKHTQTGYTVIMLLIAGFIIAIIGTIRYENNIVPIIVLFMLLICIFLFFSLTIIIDDKHIKFSFGIGLIKKKFPLDDIVDYKIVKNAWYYGWGIRLTPHGWLYNVSGFTALEIILKSGAKYRIGTDNPQGLENALKEALKSQSG